MVALLQARLGLKASLKAGVNAFSRVIGIQILLEEERWTSRECLLWWLPTFTARE